MILNLSHGETRPLKPVQGPQGLTGSARHGAKRFGAKFAPGKYHSMHFANKCEITENLRSTVQTDGKDARLGPRHLTRPVLIMQGLHTTSVGKRDSCIRINFPSLCIHVGPVGKTAQTAIRSTPQWQDSL